MLDPIRARLPHGPRWSVIAGQRGLMWTHLGCNRADCLSTRWTIVEDRAGRNPHWPPPQALGSCGAPRPGTSSVLGAFQPDDQIDHWLAGQDRNCVGGLHSHVPSCEKLAVDRHRAAVADDRPASVDLYHQSDGWKGATVCGRKPRKVGRPKRQDGSAGPESGAGRCAAAVHFDDPAALFAEV